MKKYKVTALFLVLIVGSTSVYAANTLIKNIDGNQVSSGLNVYPDQQIRTVNTGDLKFMNRDNDTNPLGDYFSGYYYDSAYGMFQTDIDTTNRVKIKQAISGKCPSTTHDGYSLEGYSYNPEFGFMNFHYDANRYAYICISKDSGKLQNTLASYIGGYAYNPMIGFQNFDGIEVESAVVVGTGSLTQGARQIKIIGLASSQVTSETNNGQFLQDIQLLGKLSKTDLRKKIQENVALAIKGIKNPSSNGNISDLSGSNGWSNADVGSPLLSGKGKYFLMDGGNITISGDNLAGNKTLVVEGGNIYITGNIIGNGILGLISLEKGGKGGNIYVAPSVTDIHAIIYADRSFVSFDGTNELDGSTSDNRLANQLYIKGSLFSENTLGGASLQKCPFYVKIQECDTKNEAAKFDLNYLRRYILVQPVDALGNPVGNKTPQFQSTTNGLQSYAGTTTRGGKNSEFEEYAVVIDYNPSVQQNPPVLLQ